VNQEWMSSASTYTGLGFEIDIIRSISTRAIFFFVLCIFFH